MEKTKPAAPGADLTAKQLKAALELLAIRPQTLPGTRAIIDESAQKEWYDKVMVRAIRLNLDPQQVPAFCDAAGVAD